MKAITLNQHGDLDNISYGDVTIPVPGPGEVLLEVKAANIPEWMSKAIAAYQTEPLAA